MSISNQLKIRPFKVDDQDPVRELILSGLEERWGILDLSQNSDLADIADTYRDGVFLVGMIDEEIVGTGAFLPEKESVCRIVRMSTRKDLRNQGIGTQVLEQLVSIAKSQGYELIALETTATWQDAVNFYLKRGFRSQGIKGGDHHFVRSIRV
jgi:GNAT superfamily N-acetyltransferase